MYATSLCKSGRYDWPAKKIVSRMPDADYNVLIYTYKFEYVFDEDQAQSIDGKPLVVMDFGEDGFDAWKNTTVLGRNFTIEGELMRLHEWVSRQRIIAYFKLDYSQAIHQSQRELGIDFYIYPIEFLSWQRAHLQPLSRDQWMSRMGNVFHLYGHTHPDRKRLHAALQVAHENVINSLAHVESYKAQGQRFDLLEQVPPFARYSIDQVYNAQKEFLFSVSLSGYAAKCYRDTEACVNAIPILADLKLKRAVPFNDRNALMLPTSDGRILTDEAVKKIDQALQNPEALYARAEAAYDTARQYQVGYYVSHFINPYIVSNL